MAVEKNKAVIERIIDEVWNGDNLAVLDELLAADYFDYGYQPRNRDGLVGTLKMMRAAFPDHKTTIEEIIADGDTVALCITLRGTHLGAFRGIAPTGKRIEIGGYRWYRVENERIASQRGLLDLPSLLQQLDS